MIALAEYPQYIDFQIYKNEQQSLEEDFSRRDSEISASLHSYTSASPDSVAYSDDARGSPVQPLVQGPRLSGTPGENSGLPGDLNDQAKRRVVEGDKGRKRRKKSTSKKRSRKDEEEEDNMKEEGQSSEDTAPGPKKIKRPRQSQFFCPVEGCPSQGWTRARELQLHMASHDLPMFECEICDAEYNRKDNFQKHLRSKKHLANEKKRLEETTELPMATSLPTSSASRSVSSSALSSPYLDGLPGHPSFSFDDQSIPLFEPPLSPEDEILQIKATIKVLQGKLSKLEDQKS
ncbi:hypothetical protein ABW19_dt0205277 [Dactylella cylindrospora]|nr:hypothetical protein ABW19_dt0205277 [Dactylella cylindrospora]